MGLAIFNRKVGMRLEVVAEGALVADGSEQVMVESPDLAILTGWISLSNLQGGDTIIIRQYVWVNTVKELYAQETFSGAQPEALLHISRRAHKDKTQITLQQTAGSYRSFDYEFVREVN